jgi:hypothetical protein
MSEFKCRCKKCGKEESFNDLKEAYMEGWNFGFNAMCWPCQQEVKQTKPDSLTNEILGGY